MPRRGESTLSTTADRLAARAERGHLRSQSMDGGEVFSGGLATRALGALGARAMTVDNSIIVGEGFNPSNPADKALFAHEQYHLQHSGGEGTHNARDAEEIAARAVERMVLHTSGGGVESHEASHTIDTTGTPSAGSSDARGTDPDANSSGPNAARGFGVFRGRGMRRPDIVEMLARQVLNGLNESRDRSQERGGGKKGLM